MNRHDVLNLQPDRSLMKKFLDEGLDIYIIDWGYPKHQHKYLTMEDYILGFMGDAVDFVRKSTGNKQIHKMGICQGGTFSAIYALFATLYLGYCFYFYNVSVLATIAEVGLFMVPFILATAALGVAVSSLFTRRDLPTQFFILISMPILFVAGFVWPLAFR